jgi:hypothetical protein
VKRYASSAVLLGATLLAACGRSSPSSSVVDRAFTTSGAIAIVNLDAEIAQRGEDDGAPGASGSKPNQQSKRNVRGEDIGVRKYGRVLGNVAGASPCSD